MPQEYCQLFATILRSVSRVGSYLFILWIGLPLSSFIFCNVCQFVLSIFLELRVG